MSQQLFKLERNKTRVRRQRAAGSGRSTRRRRITVSEYHRRQRCWKTEKRSALPAAENRNKARNNKNDRTTAALAVEIFSVKTIVNKMSWVIMSMDIASTPAEKYLGCFSRDYKQKHYQNLLVSAVVQPLMPMLLPDLQSGWGAFILSSFFVLLLSDLWARGGLTRKKSSEKNLKGDTIPPNTIIRWCGFHCRSFFPQYQSRRILTIICIFGWKLRERRQLSSRVPPYHGYIVQYSATVPVGAVGSNIGNDVGIRTFLHL